MGIHYELREYEVDPNDLAAETVAAKIGLPPEQVFKTLVARGDRNGIVMAVIPRHRGRNLEGLAAVGGGRKKKSLSREETERARWRYLRRCRSPALRAPDWWSWWRKDN